MMDLFSLRHIKIKQIREIQFNSSFPRKINISRSMELAVSFDRDDFRSVNFPGLSLRSFLIYVTERETR